MAVYKTKDMPWLIRDKYRVARNKIVKVEAQS